MKTAIGSPGSAPGVAGGGSFCSDFHSIFCDFRRLLLALYSTKAFLPHLMMVIIYNKERTKNNLKKTRNFLKPLDNSYFPNYTIIKKRQETVLKRL
jgi:hypothetical protein